MKYIWQAILHRWYMGYWPTRNNLPPMPELIDFPEGCVMVIDEYSMTRAQMDEYIDPVIQTEIDRFLSDVLEG